MAEITRRARQTSSGSSSAAAPPPSVEPIPREEQAAIVKELEDAARDAVTLSRGLLTFLGGALFVLHAFFGLRALAVAVDPEGGHFVMRHHAVLASVVPASVAALVETASTLAAALGVAAARLGLDGAAAIGKAAAPGAARRQARAATLAGAAVALSGAVCFFWVWAILVARADAEQDIAALWRAWPLPLAPGFWALTVFGAFSAEKGARRELETLRGSTYDLRTA